jgi:signal transduction histidine kinase
MPSQVLNDYAFDSPGYLKVFAESDLKICLINLENCFLFANKSIGSLFQGICSTRAGDSFMPLLAPESYSEFYDIQQELLNSDHLINVTRPIFCSHAPGVSHQISVSLIRNPEGEPQYFRVLIRDPGQMINLACTEDSSNSELALAIICAVGRNGFFTRCEGADTLNIVKSPVGRHYTEVYEGLQETQDRVLRAMSGEKFDVEVYHEGFWYQVWYQPLVSCEGKPCGATWTSFSIDKQKRLEVKLKEEIKLREDLISITSHEIRSPLSALSLQLQLMEKVVTDNKEGTKKLIDMGKRQVSSIATLVEKNLNAARISSCGVALEVRPCNLVNIVNSVFEKCSLKHQATGLQITIEAPPAVHGKWDEFRIEQVLENLFSNAIKYGEGKPIVIRLIPSTSTVSIEVEDQGRGVKPCYQEKIFDRYERMKEHNKISGFGMGLYIVKKIVEAHGGTITVKSGAGRGSLFRVVIPRFC